MQHKALSWTGAYFLWAFNTYLILGEEQAVMLPGRWLEVSEDVDVHLNSPQSPFGRKSCCLVVFVMTLVSASLMWTSRNLKLLPLMGSVAPAGSCSLPRSLHLSFWVIPSCGLSGCQQFLLFSLVSPGNRQPKILPLWAIWPDKKGENEAVWNHLLASKLKICLQIVPLNPDKCGGLAIFESMFCLFGAGLLVSVLGRGPSQPISSEGKGPTIPSSKCLHSILLGALCVHASWLEFHACHLGDATEGRGNTVSSQPTRDESKQGAAADLDEPTAARLQHAVLSRTGIGLLKIIYAFGLFSIWIGLVWIRSADTFHWAESFHLQFRHLCLITSTSNWSISHQISAHYRHIYKHPTFDSFIWAYEITLLLVAYYIIGTSCYCNLFLVLLPPFIHCVVTVLTDSIFFSAACDGQQFGGSDHDLSSVFYFISIFFMQSGAWQLKSDPLTLCIQNLRRRALHNCNCLNNWQFFSLSYDNSQAASPLVFSSVFDSKL